jgi:hypothetical protein
VWEAREREGGFPVYLFGARLLVTTGNMAHHVCGSSLAHTCSESLPDAWYSSGSEPLMSMLAGSPQSHARHRRPQHMHAVRSTIP